MSGVPLSCVSFGAGGTGVDSGWLPGRRTQTPALVEQAEQDSRVKESAPRFAE